MRWLAASVVMALRAFGHPVARLRPPMLVHCFLPRNRSEMLT
jgi:hypothetical protein